MAVTILSNPFVKDVLLPFILVFAVVFAVLEKSEILGKGKKQTDAIVALAVGLLVIAVGYGTNIITNLMPILGVGLVVILSFMLLYGMAFKEGEFKLHKGIQTAIGILGAIAVAAGVIYYAGWWDNITSFFEGGMSTWVTNIVFILLIIGAVIAVIYPSGKKEESK